MTRTLPAYLASFLILCSCGKTEPVVPEGSLPSDSIVTRPVVETKKDEKPNEGDKPKVDEDDKPLDPDAPPPPPTNPVITHEAIINAAVARTNYLRRENNLPELALDEKLTLAAQRHAEDMKARNFFDHKNPDGLMPEHRAKAAGAVFRDRPLENIAQGVNEVDTVFKMWMNSPNHRRNLLANALRRHGIGYVDGHWVHVFAD